MSQQAHPTHRYCRVIKLGQSFRPNTAIVAGSTIKIEPVYARDGRRRKSRIKLVVERLAE